MRTDWTVREDIEEAKAALREAGEDDHPYGPWSGGSKASGGGPGLGTKEQRIEDMKNRVGADRAGNLANFGDKDARLKGAASDIVQPDFNTIKEANDWATGVMPTEFKGQELRAAKEYIGGNYTGINNHLRYRGDPPVPAAWRREPGSIKHLDSLIAKNKTPVEMTVTRNSSLRTWGGGKNLLGMQGKTIIDDGFMSTNIGGNATGFGSKAVKLNIKVPKGTSAVYLGSISKYKKKEAELLLGRSTHLKITKVERSGGKYNVFAEVVGSSPAPLQS